MNTAEMQKWIYSQRLDINLLMAACYQLFRTFTGCYSFGHLCTMSSICVCGNVCKFFTWFCSARAHVMIYHNYTDYLQETQLWNTDFWLISNKYIVDLNIWFTREKMMPLSPSCLTDDGYLRTKFHENCNKVERILTFKL